MARNPFLLAHGEKIALGLVAAICGGILIISHSGGSLQPEGVTQETIDEANNQIERCFKGQNPPDLRAPRPYLDQLRERLARPVPAAAPVAWLSAMPDVGTTDGKSAFYYVYEMPVPAIELTDQVGSLAVGFELPAGKLRGRIGSGADAEWTRDDVGKVSNRARIVGIQLESKVSDGEWTPIRTGQANAEGMVPVSPANAKRTLDILDPEVWQEHHVRARYVVVATGYDITAPPPERAVSTVLVHRGPIRPDDAGDASTARPQPVDEPASGRSKPVPKANPDEQFIFDLGKQIQAGGVELLASLLPGAPAGPLPAEFSLRPGERVYLSDWSPVATAIPTSEVRFAFIGTTETPGANGQVQVSARFLMNRQIRQGKESKWPAAPAEVRIPVGELLTAQVKLTDPWSSDRKEDRTVKLETPFKVASVLRDQKRIVSWSVRAKKAAQGKGRILELDAKEISTEVVVLANKDSGREVRFVKIGKLPQPRDSATSFPFRSAYDELTDFSSNPTTFRQWELEPPKPVLFQPDEGPLPALAVEKGDRYRTDTPYFVFPDQRLVWWDADNNKLQTEDPFGVEKGGVGNPAPGPAPKAAGPRPGQPPAPPMVGPPGGPPGPPPPANPSRK